MRRFFVATAAAVIIAMGLGSAMASDPVRIGFSIAQTGLFSQAAPSQMTAYELWRDDVNAAGGLNVAGKQRMVEFVFYDDESDPSKTAQIYES